MFSSVGSVLLNKNHVRIVLGMIALSVTIALSGSVMGSAYAMQDIVIENSPRSSYVPVSDAQASSDRSR